MRPGQGAPEFRPEARYNQDNAYLLATGSTSTDVYVVMFKTPLNSAHASPLPNGQPVRTEHA
ncbi:hypothetical protein ACU8WE_18530 [Pseudomonas parakoreensis]